MPEYHLTCPGRELTFVDDPEAVVATLRDLDATFAADGRSVLVGLDTEAGSLDVGLGVLHAAVVITTEEEPGYVALGESESDAEVMLDFDGEPTPFPEATVLSGEVAFAIVDDFLAGTLKSTKVAWQEF